MWKNKVRLGLSLFGVLLLFSPSPVFAETLSSPTYQVDQTFFGTGGELDACSGNYCAKEAAGELTIGNVCGTDYCAWTGFNTTDEPFLEFVVTADNIDLGYLDTGSASTANGQFVVRAWQAGGYVVRTESNPPTNTATIGYQLAPMAPGATDAPVVSVPGTEQFGINLVVNTLPVSFGAVPQQMPDSTMSFGQVANRYDVPNNYKYVKGDVVAQSDTSSSITAYTVSYVFNISQVTPAGQYDFNHVLVATATY